MSAPLHLRPGDAFGAFLLLEELGRGGAGAVWRARDSRGREFALKVMLRPESEVALARFQREGELTARLAHPGIVKVHASGVVQGWPFLVCELVAGSTLEAFARRSGPDARARVVLQVARAVGYAHSQGVVHRDLKPANVLVDAEGVARVADFGAASAADLERLTQTGALVGTPLFMAPEQLAGRRDAWGPPTDVWALGVMLYESLTDRYPFSGDSLVALSARVVRGDPVPPIEHDPGISRALNAVCLRALQVDPQARYPHGGAFAEALEAALSGDASEGSRLRRAYVAGALGVALCAGGVGWLWVEGRAPAGGTAGSTPAPPAAPADPVAPPRDPRAEALAREFAARSGALRARLLEERPSQDQVCDELGELRAIAQRASPGGELQADSELLNALVVWARGEVQGRRSPAEALAAAAALGGRVTDRNASLDLLETGAVQVAIRALSAADWAALLPSFVRLDMTLGPPAPTSDYTRFAPAGEGPYGAFVRLRLASDLAEPRQALQRMLREPPPGLELGPVSWGDAACDVAPGLGQDEGFALLREARRRDPRNPEVARTLTKLLWNARLPEETLEAAEWGIALFEAEGYSVRSMYHDEWVRFVFYRTWALAKLGRRAEARAGYAQLDRLDTGMAQSLRKTWDWIDGSGD
ncbi:MAG: protein kinase [Planctomycetes bacterium]|nr:protein kinase [Planctomycetota bacterium]